MKIAFDLDDTLIPTRPDVPTESGLVFAFAGLFFRELLRKGTRQLLKQLDREGHDVWINTTLRRYSFVVKIWFRCLGIRLGGVINGLCHARTVSTLKGSMRNASNYPPAFCIDFLVDESKGGEGGRISIRFFGDSSFSG